MNRKNYSPQLDNEDERIYCYAVDKLVRYIHKRKIKQVVLLDRSARGAYIGVKKMWSELYPEEKPPYIYFLNPGGIGYNDDTDKFESVFKNSYLINHKEESLLVFDTCIHDGDVMHKATNFLQKQGFTKLIIGAGHTSNRAHCKVKEDFTIFTSGHVTCYPFGYSNGNMVEKTRWEVVSALNDDKRENHIGFDTRKQILDIMNDYTAMSKYKRKKYVEEIEKNYCKHHH